MSIAFNIILNVLLISSFIVFIIMLVRLVITARDPLERVLRAASLFCGALIVLGSQASGLSYADFIVKSLRGSNTLGVGILAAVAPALAGATIGWYFVRSMKRSDSLTIRVLAFIGMLSTTQFAAVYVVAVNKHGVNIGETAVPNIAFVVSLLLYIILKIDAKGDAESGGSGGGGRFLSHRNRSTNGSGTAKTTLR